MTSVKMEIKINFFKEDLIKAIGSGVYEINVSKDRKSGILYIGESVFVLVRCASHLYELKKEPNYFGFTADNINDPNITLDFTLLEENNHTVSRKEHEKKYIADKLPISQNGISDRQKNREDKIKALAKFLSGD